jgi:hypothetical protein
MPSQPNIGIRAWKKPKRNAIRMTQRDGSFMIVPAITKEPSLCVRIIPLTMETVKQSMARATAKRMISKRFI